MQRSTDSDGRTTASDGDSSAQQKSHNNAPLRTAARQPLTAAQEIAQKRPVTAAELPDGRPAAVAKTAFAQVMSKFDSRVNDRLGTPAFPQQPRDHGPNARPSPTEGPFSSNRPPGQRTPPDVVDLSDSPQGSKKYARPKLRLRTLVGRRPGSDKPGQSSPTNATQTPTPNLDPYIDDGTESDTDPEPAGTHRAPAAKADQGKADGERRNPAPSKDHLGDTPSHASTAEPDGQAATDKPRPAIERSTTDKELSALYGVLLMFSEDFDEALENISYADVLKVLHFSFPLFLGLDSDLIWHNPPGDGKCGYHGLLAGSGIFFQDQDSRWQHGKAINTLEYRTALALQSVLAPLGPLVPFADLADAGGQLVYNEMRVFAFLTKTFVMCGTTPWRPDPAESYIRRVSSRQNTRSTPSEVIHASPTSLEIIFVNSQEDEREVARRLLRNFRDHSMIGLYLDTCRGPYHSENGDHYHVAINPAHGLYPTEAMVIQWTNDPWSLLHLMYSLNRTTHKFSRSHRRLDAPKYAEYVIERYGAGFERYQHDDFKLLCERMGATQFKSAEVPTPILEMRQELTSGLRAIQDKADGLRRQQQTFKDAMDAQEQERHNERTQHQATLTALGGFKADLNVSIKALADQVQEMQKAVTLTTAALDCRIIDIVDKLEYQGTMIASLEQTATTLRKNQGPTYTSGVYKAASRFGIGHPGRPADTQTHVNWARDDPSSAESNRSDYTPASGTGTSMSYSAASSATGTASQTPDSGGQTFTDHAQADDTPATKDASSTRRALDETFQQFDDRGQYTREGKHVTMANGFSGQQVMVDPRSGAAIAVTPPQWTSLAHNETQTFFRKLEEFSRLQPLHAFRGLIPTASRDYYMMIWDEEAMRYPAPQPELQRWMTVEAGTVTNAVIQVQQFIRLKFANNLRYAHYDSKTITCQALTHNAHDHKFERYIVAQLEHQRQCNRPRAAAKKFFVEGLKQNNFRFATALDQMQLHTTHHDGESFETFVGHAKRFLKDSIQFLPADGDSSRPSGQQQSPRKENRPSKGKGSNKNTYESQRRDSREYNSSRRREDSRSRSRSLSRHRDDQNDRGDRRDRDDRRGRDDGRRHDRDQDQHRQSHTDRHSHRSASPYQQRDKRQRDSPERSRSRSHDSDNSNKTGRQHRDDGKRQGKVSFAAKSSREKEA